MPSDHPLNSRAYWELDARDSVTITWTDGFTGIWLKLGASNGQLRGRALTLSDTDDPNLNATAEATPADCPVASARSLISIRREAVTQL